MINTTFLPLQWRHNEREGISNHPRDDCLLSRWFRCRSKKISKIRVTGLCAGKSPVNSPYKGSVTRKMSPFDDVIMHHRKSETAYNYLIIETGWRLYVSDQGHHWFWLWLYITTVFLHGLILIPSWINNYIHYSVCGWHYLTIPWISTFFPHFTGLLISYLIHAGINAKPS